MKKKQKRIIIIIYNNCQLNLSIHNFNFPHSFVFRFFWSSCLWRRWVCSFHLLFGNSFILNTRKLFAIFTHALRWKDRSRITQFLNIQELYQSMYDIGLKLEKIWNWPVWISGWKRTLWLGGKTDRYEYFLFSVSIYWFARSFVCCFSANVNIGWFLTLTDIVNGTAMKMLINRISKITKNTTLGIIYTDAYLYWLLDESNLE